MRRITVSCFTMAMDRTAATNLVPVTYGVTYKDGNQWHMFYLGTPNVTPAPHPEIKYYSGRTDSLEVNPIKTMIQSLVIQLIGCFA